MEQPREQLQPAAPAGGVVSEWITATLSTLRSSFKWLQPGLNVKRWLLLALLGIAFLVMGIDLLFILQIAEIGDELNTLLLEMFAVTLRDRSDFGGLPYQTLLGVPLSLLGLMLFIYGTYNLVSSVTSAVIPDADQSSIVDVIWRRRQLSHGPRIVVIGGGTGLSTLLRGLKQYTNNITAIVTVTDDGGSSGRLRHDYKMLPPGDIRNCLVALADAEPLMQELFQYRFSSETGDSAQSNSLEGHSFGNLLIAAMTAITGDFEDAVRQTSRVLAIRGRVLPSTVDHVNLKATFEDGTEETGETKIAAKKIPISHMALVRADDAGTGAEPEEMEAEPLDEALEAIDTADAIVIGPGSLYTSLLPNFLVSGVTQRVAESRALKIYVCNVMTQPGETQGFTASDHVKSLTHHAGMRLFDYVLVNSEQPPETALRRYSGVGAEWVRPDLDEIRHLGLRPIKGSFISRSNVVRHDADKLARMIIRMVNRHLAPTFWFFDRRGQRGF